jgi:hypothetical protein
LDNGLQSLNVQSSALSVGRCGGTAAASALRQLLAERFPAAARAVNDALATGLPAIDAAAGGLPRPGLTELVCSAPSCGSQLLLGQLLQATRAHGLRVALVDRDDAFDPGSWPAFALEHLVWVRPRHLEEALAAADLLARDANLGLLVLDLRHTSRGELRRIPATRWYRLQRALEPALVAGLVLTPSPLVPGTHLRLALVESHTLDAQRGLRPELTTALAPELLRQRAHAIATG